jgi:hypothetical protein
MPVIRKFAVQGHAIPNGAYRAQGPFPSEIFAQNPRAQEEVAHSDSLHEALDDVRMFRCKECADVLYSYELDTHECEEDEEQGYYE